ncbi:hypothetical protein D3C72_1759430 [compost metagenome]
MLLDRTSHLGDVALEAARGMSKIMGEQQRDVFAAFPQGRDADRDHVQTVEQVFAELGAYGGAAQVFLGGGHHAQIQITHFVAA